jgi:CPA1 family monovalent cation:H+ antiporter
MIIFLAFSVILVTLVLQGLTLPPLIRGLRLAGGALQHPEETEARRAILQAALNYLDQVREQAKPELVEVYDDLSRHYRSRLATLQEEEENGQAPADSIGPQLYNRQLELQHKVLMVERQTAIRLRYERRISDEFLRELERELDLSESRFTAPRG